MIYDPLRFLSLYNICIIDFIVCYRNVKPLSTCNVKIQLYCLNHNEVLDLDTMAFGDTVNCLMQEVTRPSFKFFSLLLQLSKQIPNFLKVWQLDIALYLLTWKRERKRMSFQVLQRTRCFMLLYNKCAAQEIHIKDCYQTTFDRSPNCLLYIVYTLGYSEGIHCANFYNTLTQ